MASIVGNLLSGGRVARPEEKEWRPSTFVSGQKAAPQAWLQQLQGIMDEEDELALFRSRGNVQSAASYGLGGAVSALAGPGSESSHINLFSEAMPREMLISAGDTHGKKLLQLHGWHSGAPLTFARRKHAGNETIEEITAEYVDTMRHIWDDGTVGKDDVARRNRWGLGYSHATLHDAVTDAQEVQTSWKRTRAEFEARQTKHALYHRALGDVDATGDDDKATAKRRRIALGSLLTYDGDEDDDVAYDDAKYVQDLSAHDASMPHKTADNNSRRLALEDTRAAEQHDTITFKKQSQPYVYTQTYSKLVVPASFVPKHTFPEGDAVKSLADNNKPVQGADAEKDGVVKADVKLSPETKTTAPHTGDASLPAASASHTQAQKQAPTTTTPDWAADRFVTATSAPQVGAERPPTTAEANKSARRFRVTRTSAQWVPDPVVLKRCNVADPFTKAQRNSMSAGSQQASTAGHEQQRPGSAHTSWTSSSAGTHANMALGSGAALGDVFGDVLASTDLAPLTAQKPPASLFSAIFGT